MGICGANRHQVANEGGPFVPFGWNSAWLLPEDCSFVQGNQIRWFSKSNLNQILLRLYLPKVWKLEKNDLKTTPLKGNVLGCHWRSHFVSMRHVEVIGVLKILIPSKNHNCATLETGCQFEHFAKMLQKNQVDF